ncbi:hypothetical protein HDV01_004862 [Terramyces sp. JEL0728]|nr:hypothetical protein HDV01_004862 [Terramyces sp. JEL0728]
MKIIQTLTVSNLIAWGPLTLVWLINALATDSVVVDYFMLLPGITVQSKGLVHYLSLRYVFRDEEEKKLPKSIQYKQPEKEKDGIDSLVLHLKKPERSATRKISLGESETSLPSDIQEIIQEFKPKNPALNMNKISLGNSENSWNSQSNSSVKILTIMLNAVKTITTSNVLYWTTVIGLSLAEFILNSFEVKVALKMVLPLKSFIHMLSLSTATDLPKKKIEVSNSFSNIAHFDIESKDSVTYPTTKEDSVVPKQNAHDFYLQTVSYSHEYQ